MTKEDKETVRTFGLSMPLEALKKIKMLAIERDISPSQIILEALCYWWEKKGHPEKDTSPLISSTNGTAVAAEVSFEETGGS
jgi:hypothetical protein